MEESKHRKKILIINNNMHIGGVQKSLLYLLKELAADPALSITLALLYRGGELLDEIPEGIEITEAGKVFRCLGMTKHDIKAPADLLTRGLAAAFTRSFGREKLFGLLLKANGKQFKPESFGKFDVAVSFLHSGKPNVFYGGCNEFLINCVDAKRKGTFLHCDYESIGADCSYNTSLYEATDFIAACSDGCRNAFIRVLPQFAGKTSVIPNCHDYEGIKELADADRRKLPDDSLNILSVARLGKEKGILRAVQAIGNLDLPVEKLRYFIIGDGADRDAVIKKIDSMNLGDRVTLLGEMLNPYGYMRAADILLIPSVSEAAPLVIDEAASLGTPVLSTETVSAREMITEKGIGWVCGNSVRGIEEGIMKLINEPDAIKAAGSGIRKIHFDNTSALEGFYGSVFEE